MTWCWTGTKPLSEPLRPSLMTLISNLRCHSHHCNGFCPGTRSWFNLRWRVIAIITSKIRYGGVIAVHNDIPISITRFCWITSFSGPGCFITPPVTMGIHGVAPDFEPTGTHLYPDYKFYCSGVIIGWNIRTLARGKITLSLWRRCENDASEGTKHWAGAYQRTGDVELLLEEGLNHVNLASDRQLEVAVGDIIGFQYRHVESNAVIAFDLWACEFGFPCNYEDIFISNESPNSFMNTTTRLTTYKEEEMRSNVYYLSYFTVFNDTPFFPKVVPIVQERGNFILSCTSKSTHVYTLTGYLA